MCRAEASMLELFEMVQDFAAVNVLM